MAFNGQLIKLPISMANMCPLNFTMISNFNGQHVSQHGHLFCCIQSLVCVAGKSYEMFSMKSQGAQETVFLNSASEPKIAGKTSRHVSLIHYPEPSELQKRNSLNLSWSQRASMTTSTISGRLCSKPRSSQAMSGYSTPSSRTKSTVSGFGEPEEKACG